MSSKVKVMRHAQQKVRRTTSKSKTDNSRDEIKTLCEKKKKK